MDTESKALFLLLLKHYKKKHEKRRFSKICLKNAISHHRSLTRGFFLSSVMRISLLGLRVRRARSIWAYPRQEFWFSRMQADETFNRFWRNDFRMSRETFLLLVALVRPRLEKRDTQLRRAIPIEKRVAIALWRLATGNSFRTVAKTFAVGDSTAVQITKEFCLELTRLSPRFIKFPQTRRDTAKAIEEFKMDYQTEFPQVVGALDGTHIPIPAPNVESKADYYSRKQCYTVSVQGLVGANLMFLDVATGFPGSCHDARNLRNSSLFRRAENQEILTKPIDVIDNSEIRPLVLGDGAYPLLSWLITPHQFGPGLTRDQRVFNRKLSSCRVHVERAFGILKARWRILLTRLDNRIENVAAVTIACVTLHNFCQKNNETYTDEDGVLENILRQERQSRQRRRQNYDRNPNGNTSRISLTNYLNQ